MDSACPLDWRSQSVAKVSFMPQSLKNSLKLWLVNCRSRWRSLGGPESSDYVCQQEFADLNVCYPAECFCFDLFWEEVSNYQKEDLLPRRHREFLHYIHAPLSEEPRWAYGFEVFWREFGNWSVPLTLIKSILLMQNFIGFCPLFCTNITTYATENIHKIKRKF